LNLFSNVHPNGFLENILLVVRQFRMFCSGRRSLRGYSFASTQIPGACADVVSSDRGGLHLRISCFQIRKRYHNH
jgi:hypothetical protein